MSILLLFDKRIKPIGCLSSGSIKSNLKQSLSRKDLASFFQGGFYLVIIFKMTACWVKYFEGHFDPTTFVIQLFVRLPKGAIFYLSDETYQM